MRFYVLAHLFQNLFRKLKLKMIQKTKVYASQKCAWCGGTGKRNLAPGNEISCIVCGGKSEVSMLQPTILCSNCAGIGKTGKSINPCLTCAGTGWEHIKD
jgi:DnaJ-class molecular chaperone